MRLTVPVVVCLLLKDLVLGTRPHDVTALNDPIALIGCLLLLSGLALRSWAAGVLRKLDTLADTGPYRLIRHPLYAGSFAMMLGVCLLIGAPEDFVIVFFLAGAMYWSQIQLEEARLAERFGATWRAYALRTGRFVPRRLTFDFGGVWRFAQWRKNREYNAVAAALLGLALLDLWHTLAR